MKKIAYCIQGILGDSENQFEWDNEFVRQTNVLEGWSADRFEYEQGALKLKVSPKLITSLTHCLNFYAARSEVHVVAHSNGNYLLLEALKELRFPLHTLWMCAPACENDFEANGLNKSLLNNRIKAVHVIRAADDEAAFWAKLSNVLPIHHYGDLLYKGPQNALPEVTDEVQPGKHSDMLKAWRLNSLVERVTG